MGILLIQLFYLGPSKWRKYEHLHENPLQKHISNENGTPPRDRREKHENRGNKLPEDTNAKIRKDNLHQYYLSPILNISKLHELYL